MSAARDSRDRFPVTMSVRSDYSTARATLRCSARGRASGVTESAQLEKIFEHFVSSKRTPDYC